MPLPLVPCQFKFKFNWNRLFSSVTHAICDLTGALEQYKNWIFYVFICFRKYYSFEKLNTSILNL